MQMYDLIQKTRRQEPLTADQIRFITEGFCDGSIPDYMMSAWLMAVCCQGLTPEETTALTLAMRDSGPVLDLSPIGAVTVDKHSTGGIGDKTTLLLAPIVAACGGCVPKMSGRGLGFTGGTIDKLESIPGFCTALSTDRFMEITKEIGCCVISQSGGLVPADKKMYALRNLTATVDSIPLICSSIMSKKLALGADCILLDVKFGHGAFMKTPEDAAALASAMVEVGTLAGRRCRAVLTDMNAPLGCAVGNALEVAEVIRILRGELTGGLRTLSLSLAAHMLELSGHGSYDDCRKRAEEALTSGQALRKFAEMLAAQGGNPAVTEDLSLLPQARESLTVHAETAGWLCGLQSEEVGLACLALGAGRTASCAEIDYGAGVMLHAAVGDRIEAGVPLFTVYGDTVSRCEQAAARILAAAGLSDTPIEAPALLHQVIGS
ncbi:MAG: thymidine phosphorylase [Oscillospiraceae bacterium]|nr:thymidine phosphorylase [Oscillospiraceae bacterium]